MQMYVGTQVKKNTFTTTTFQSIESIIMNHCNTQRGRIFISISNVYTSIKVFSLKQTPVAKPSANITRGEVAYKFVGARD